MHVSAKNSFKNIRKRFLVFYDSDMLSVGNPSSKLPTSFAKVGKFLMTVETSFR
jgi:hypothetical protein